MQVLKIKKPSKRAYFEIRTEVAKSVTAYLAQFGERRATVKLTNTRLQTQN